MNKVAPVVLFVYNRPEHTKKMIESLANNALSNETEVYIFSDNAKKEKDKINVEKVRKIIRETKQKKIFKNVIINEAEKNKGLANSVIEGVTKVINEHGKAIVLEDDLVLSTTFLQYMNNALKFYEKNEKIWSISGYNLPITIPKNYKEDVYLSYRGCSWGWATWKDRWDTVDWDVKDYNKFKHSYKRRKRLNRGGPDMAQMLDFQMKGLCDSWAIRWCYEQSKQDRYTVYPTKSLIQNKGTDGSGTHSGNTNLFDTKNYNEIPKLKEDLTINKEIIKTFNKKFYAGRKQTILEFLIILRLDNMIDRIRKVKSNLNGK